MVSATNIEYKFTIYPGNDIPQDSMVYIYFPTINGKEFLDCNT